MGIVEPKHYIAGKRLDGNNWLAGATPANSNLLYTGGEPQTPDSFNVFKLSVFNTGYARALPAGNDSPNQHYYLNSFPEQAAKFRLFVESRGSVKASVSAPDTALAARDRRGVSRAEARARRRFLRAEAVRRPWREASEDQVPRSA